MNAELAAQLTAARAISDDYARESAETRRPDWYAWSVRLRTALAGLITAIDGQAAPTSQQRAVLGQALADAIAHRDPSGICTACEAEHGGLCYDHAGDLDRTDAYLALARQLGLEVDR